MRYTPKPERVCWDLEATRDEAVSSYGGRVGYTVGVSVGAALC